MRPFSAFFVLIGTLLAASGYGATFFLSMHFRSMGGNDLDTGLALAEATVGTLVGVPLVGWFAQRIGAARTTALAALCIGLGVAGFALIDRMSGLSVFPGFLVGFGWGAFCLAAPMALAERTSDTDRGFWFMRFGTIQMAGIGGCPAAAAFAIRSWHWPLTSVLYLVGGLCALAALMLEVFGRISPHSSASPVQERWLRQIGAISRTRAAYPIVMISLRLRFLRLDDVPDVFRARHACTGGYLFQPVCSDRRGRPLAADARRDPATSRSRDEAAARHHGARHRSDVRGAVLHRVPCRERRVARDRLRSRLSDHSGAGGQRLRRDAPAGRVDVVRRRVLVGTFGFPAIGGWVLVHLGKIALIALIAICGLAALMLAIMRDKHDRHSIGPFAGA